jgi:hypothetical protein
MTPCPEIRKGPRAVLGATEGFPLVVTPGSVRKDGCAPREATAFDLSDIGGTEDFGWRRRPSWGTVALRCR